MKRMFKISLVILLIGLILMGIGFAGHGMKNIQLNGGVPVIEHSTTKKLSTKSFSKLDIQTGSPNVVIKAGKKYSIEYQGSNSRVPKVKINGDKATIKQQENYNGISLTRDGDDDTIIITVPKDQKLTGKIDVTDGDLNITGVDLTDLDVNATDGDVVYNHLTIQGGQTTLGDGDFTSHNVIFKGHYSIKNTDGDNKVIGSHADGFILQTTDGDNKLDGVDHGEEDLQKNPSATNLLQLKTTDGDNSVINIKAVQ